MTDVERQLYQDNWYRFKDFLARLGDVALVEIAGGERPGSPRAVPHHPRTRILEEFENFLQSPQRFMVLVGGSGSGKSSSLAHLDEVIRNRQELAGLFINAARDDIPTDLRAFIDKNAEDSKQHATDPSIVRRFLAPNSKVSDDLRVVVLVDAINENRSLGARRVFHAFYRAAETSLGAERIKFVLTSRLHPWKQVREHSNPALVSELFYVPVRARDKNILATRLGGFETEQDVQVAYDRYRRHFGGQQAYAKLSTRIQCLLAEPLSMRLLTEAFREEPIPTNFVRADLHATYEQRLVARGVLDEERDLTVLDALSVAMTDRRVNSLGSDDLTRLFGSNDGGTVLQRLVKSGILQEVGDDRGGLQIQFRYESFYDHHVGACLARWVKEAGPGPAARAGRFGDWIESMVDERVYLWGPLRVALGHIVADDSPFQIGMLAAAGNDQLQDALVAALKLFAVERVNGSARVERLLVELSGLWVARLPRPPRAAIFRHLDAHERKLRLVETVAAAATRTQLMKPLLPLAASPVEAIRQIAVRHAYELAERAVTVAEDTRFIDEFIGGLAEHAGPLQSRLPNVLLALIEFSCLLLMNHIREPIVRRALWQRLRPALLERYLFTHADSAGFSRAAKPLLQRALRFVALQAGLRRLQDPSPHVVANDWEYSGFFQTVAHIRPLEPQERQLMSRLLVHFEPTNSIYIDSKSGELDLRPDFKQTAHDALVVGDAMLSSVLEMVLGLHGAKEPKAILPWIELIFEETIEHPERFAAPAVSRFDLMQSFYMACETYVACHEETEPRLDENGEQALQSRHRNHVGKPSDAGALIEESWLASLALMGRKILRHDNGFYRTRLGEWWRTNGNNPSERRRFSYGALSMHWYAALYTRKNRNCSQIPEFSAAVHEAIAVIEKRGLSQLQSLINSLGVFRAKIFEVRALLRCFQSLMEPGACVALEARCSFDPERDDPDAPQLATLLINNLAAVRSRYRSEVDEFLSDCDASPEFRLAVKQAQKPPSLGDAFAHTDFAAIAALERVPPIRRWLVRAFANALTASDTRSWVDGAMLAAMEECRDELRRSASG